MDDQVTLAPEPDETPDPGASVRPAVPRSIKRSLASIVLGFETIVVMLGALVIFGLGALPPLLALGGGALLSLAMVAVIALLRYPWSYVIGWILQAIVLLCGFLNPAMFFVGAMFTAMWAYCMIAGSRIDNQKENS
ncbi:DUF4233 domain-containing protein [Cryobacterium sp. TMT4-10]|uniref:DUF4233 domain-containing protein n=1 Tax=Cryobacterium shii TaxID=1259235 RepID=A0AAQ2C4U0_9MICO|nr:DUF4233 domain-containing protein [Cryobacterium shii]TFD13733.1 DUF4233 domain-containing protein [Cryobacterium sp. TMT4-10]TFD19750.1 DUF4233 domain-containing protein [Cryobacterium sp. TMT2-23]